MTIMPVSSGVTDTRANSAEVFQPLAFPSTAEKSNVSGSVATA